MRELANRLMLNGQRGTTDVPTAIFGTAGTLAQSIYAAQPSTRIGLWPIQSQKTPNTAMGLFVIMGYLFDQYADTHTYRLITRLDTNNKDDYKWDISKSQFDVDDWQLDNLDDNVGIWGQLEEKEQTLTLTINVESDLLEEKEVKNFQWTAGTLSNLISKLPDGATQIARYLDIKPKLITTNYYPGDWNTGNLNRAFDDIFNWELKLYLHLWGIPWQPNQIRSDLEQLRSSAQSLGSLGTWLISHAILRVITFTDIHKESWLLPTIRDIVHKTEIGETAAALLGTALFDVQQTEQAYQLLEDATVDSDHPQATTYLALAELYRRGGRIAEAIDTFQYAIENSHTSVHLYQRYAETLITLDYNNLEYDTLILVDPDSTPDDTLLWEAVEAYQAALNIEPENTDILTSQLFQLIELNEDDERLWPNFGHLVQSDHSGERVRTIIDSFYNLQNVQPAIEILEQAVETAPRRANIYINLAVLYMLEDENNRARATLQKARQFTQEGDHETIADIERLILMTDEPEFEARLGEIEQILDAGSELGSKDVEFLEATLSRAPNIAEAYILLAKAYNGWEENASALETLLDGHKRLPNDPDIIVLLCETLWASGEDELALSYLSNGLSNNPNHVPLLALAGLFLFEDGQEEAARIYLTKAEMIDPRNPTLAQIRIQIARQIS